MVNGFKQTTFNLSNDEDNDNAAARGWVWICCGMAMGWFETTDNGNGMFSNSVPLSYYLKECTDVFGPQINTAYVTKKVAESAGYLNYPWNYNATNVVLPNGGYDSWHALGTYVNDTSRHQTSVLIPSSSTNHPNRIPPGYFWILMHRNSVRQLLI